MDEVNRRGKIADRAPWLVSLVLLLVLVVVLVRSRSTQTDVFGNVSKQSEIVAGMRTNLLESLSAEKSGLLATTEEQTREFVEQSRRAAEAVQAGRRELGPLVNDQIVPNETRFVQEFDEFWKEFQELQNRVLDLSIQGTNLKAMALSSGKGQEALKRFEESLTAIAQANASKGTCGQVGKLCSEALIALMKVEYLHTPHIQAVTDQEMDRIEKEMRSQDQIAQDALAALADLIDPSSKEELERATQAYVNFADVSDEVIKLSRTNSNIKSVELAMGKERLAAAKCDDVLGTLLAAFRTTGSRATR